MVCCLNDRTALSGQNDLGRLLNGLLSGLLIVCGIVLVPPIGPAFFMGVCYALTKPL